MESWSKVIVEWINCLNILDVPISDIKDLEDRKCYSKIIVRCLCEQGENAITDDDHIALFLKDEYPDFKFEENNELCEVDNLYIASLLLLRSSQEHIFHEPMCCKLEYETQLKIRSFLEQLVICEKPVTRELINEAITHVETAISSTPREATNALCTTPKTQSLTDFLNSPASKSVHKHRRMIQDRRELRRLQSELEVERYEKMYLQDDLQKEQSKTQSLQKRLQEKQAELKALQEERFKQVTPQSCKKNKKISILTEQYRKEVERLEDQLMKYEIALGKANEEKNVLAKTVTTVQNECTDLMEKCNNSDVLLRRLESQIQCKEEEMLCLRSLNDELRGLLKELNETAYKNYSFEVDNSTSLCSQFTKLNTDEPLSSVIEIQLQEIKEEAGTLKGQLERANENLATITREHQKISQHNTDLKAKLEILDNVNTEYMQCQENLCTVTRENENLKVEKVCLLAQLEQSKNLITSETKLLLESKKANEDLHSNICVLNIKISDLERRLKVENTNFTSCNAALTETKLELEKKSKHNEKLSHENLLTKHTVKYVDKKLKCMLQNNHIKIRTSDLNNLKIEDVIKQCEQAFQEYSVEIASLKEIDTQKDKSLHELKQIQTDKDILIHTLATDVKQLRDCFSTMKTTVEEQQQVFKIQLGTCEEQMKRTIKEISDEYKKLQTSFENLTLTSVQLTQELSDNKKKLEKVQVRNREIAHDSLQKNDIITNLELKIKSLCENLNESTLSAQSLIKERLGIEQICIELTSSVKNVKLAVVNVCSHFNISPEEQTLHNGYVDNDNEKEQIVQGIKSVINEMSLLQRAVFYLGDRNKSLNNEIVEHKRTIANNEYIRKDHDMLKECAQNFEKMKQDCIDNLEHFIKDIQSLTDTLTKVMLLNLDLNRDLSSLKQKWNGTLGTFQNTLIIDKSMCDELKQLQATRTLLENTLQDYDMRYLQSSKLLLDILWKKFSWTQEKLQEMYSELNGKPFPQTPENMDKDTGEEGIIEYLLQEHETLISDISKTYKKIEEFSDFVTTYENDVKPKHKKDELKHEQRLKVQIDHLSTEKQELKNKLDAVRTRNTKLERNMDELRNEIKTLKSELSMAETLKIDVIKLKDEKEELKKQFKQHFDQQLKEVYVKYEHKLDEMKQKMKTAYNDQVIKLHSEQEKVLQEKLESYRKKVEQQCLKHAEEISKYKAHVSELSSKYWNVAEKLLTEQQQKKDALKELKNTKLKFPDTKNELSHQTISTSLQHKSSEINEQVLSARVYKEKLHITKLPEETTHERRHSVRSIQVMGNAFNAEDEEGEVFDNNYLADMKEGNCMPTSDIDRMSVLQMRNSRCKPHLKSSYPAEMQFYPSGFNEEEIKTGSVTEDIFNDSLSQSLLPEQKARRKDRTQTSYKKPGPPTPSKNGGRLSLQGNDSRSPQTRVLRERNTDRRTTTTPRTLKHLFSKRTDENVTGTPRGRRLSSIFRRTRSTLDR